MASRASSFAWIPGVCMAAQVTAHHSQSEFNLDPAVIETISGTVTQFDFKNPHVYLYLEAREADGSVARWELEASSTPNLIRRGWSRDSVQPGDELVIEIHPAKVPGQHIARIATIYFPDGSTLAVRGEGGITAPANPDARSDSLAGRWLGHYGLGQVQFDLDQWPLTAAGATAQRSYDVTQNPQVSCIPVTAPILMLYQNLFDVRVAADRVVIEYEWLDVERTVYLDGRAHPPADELTLQGHSIGRFEGRSLVIDTANFLAHGAGNAFEVPSSTRKHLIERLALSADGRRVDYTFELEDPAYLSAPVTGGNSWDYRPDLNPQPVECDREVARRFLERRLGGE